MIRELLQSISGYPGLFLACVASGLVIPLPEDFPLLYAGMQVADGSWGVGIVLAISVIGVGIRDMLAWGLGRAIGDTLLKSGWARRLLGAGKIDRASEMVRTRGARAVLIGRFLVGFRAPVFVVAGATGVPLRAFVVYDTIGLVVMVPITVLAGYWFGQPLADGLFWGLQRTRLVVVAVVAIGALWAVYRVWGSPGDDEPAGGGVDGG